MDALPNFWIFKSAQGREAETRNLTNEAFYWSLENGAQELRRIINSLSKHFSFLKARRVSPQLSNYAAEFFRRARGEVLLLDNPSSLNVWQKGIL
jgi:hypothetical protein